jgi:hypothetical protein
MSEIGKAGSGHEADVARANHGNAHRTNLQREMLGDLYRNGLEHFLTDRQLKAWFTVF